jgi:RHS repeat-associated protein
VLLPGKKGEETVTINYTYDPLYRLTAADYSTGDYYHYAYDSVGNRLTETTQLATKNYVYDDANRLASVDGINYTFDANGNLLNDGVNTYTYDFANRLTSVNGTDSYSYNGLGDRLTQNGVHYTLDLNTGLTQVLSDGTNTYTYGLGRVSQTNTQTEYFLGDALGSVRQLTASNGDVTLAKSYDPYGVITATAGTSLTDYGFTGEAQNSYTNLVYLRARFYNPLDGRFQSRDTWGGNGNSPMSFNRWMYVEGNPVNYTDPNGHIRNEAMQAAKADLISEKLHDIYNVNIEKDWGYRLIIGSPTYYGKGPIPYSCEWQEGNWRSAHELDLVFESVREMAKKLGGATKFKSAMGNRPVFVYRYSNASYIINPEQNWAGLHPFLPQIFGDVLLYDGAFNYDDYARGVIVHELSHAWDYRQGRGPSTGMMFETGAYNLECSKDINPEVCPISYDVYASPEKAPSGYVYDMNNKEEDWADSVMTFVYPALGPKYGKYRDSDGILGPKRKRFITDAIHNIPNGKFWRQP